MKQFARSIPGKTFLIIMTVVFCCMHMFLAHVTMALMDEGVFDEPSTGTTMRAKIWEVDEEYLLEKSWIVMEDVLIDCLQAVETKVYPMEQFPIAFRIYEEEGELIGSTEEFDPDGAATEVHNYWYGVVKSDMDTILTDELFIITPEEENNDWEMVFRIDCYSVIEPSRSVFDSIVLWTYANCTWIPIISVISAILAVILIVWLMCVSGHRPNTEEVFPGPLDPVPYDFMVVVSAGLVFLFYQWGRYYFGSSLISAMTMLLLVTLAIGDAMSLACRVKRKALAHNTIIYRIGYPVLKSLKWLAERGADLINGIPLIWRSFLFIGIFVSVDLVLVPFFRRTTGSDFFYWTIKLVVLGPILLWYALCIERLQIGVKRLSSGELDYHIDTRHMPFDLKSQGERMNKIAEGMKLVIEKEVRSEHMKTELLTNVSHDIKTPLTSIISYADLISIERNDSEKVAQYAEVLTRQATRLKRLLEDLVEASKASTGNLEINLELTNMSVLLQQAAGEYEERMAELGLTQVLELPEQDIMIMADGRRMWRIFDNLSSNVCKYALTGTRVFIRMEQQGNDCRLSFTNISREPLNINEEELMERFVRGDRARNTEGSGLGLSIARSLTELQHGKMEIRIDGDLFKTVLVFPIAQV